MRFSQQVYQDGLPFPPPADHVLLEYSAVTHLSWVTLHGMAHSFIELRRPLRYDKTVIHEGDSQICGSSHPHNLMRMEESERADLRLNIKKTKPHSVQFSSVPQSCPTLCDPMNRSTPHLPVHHQLPEFTQTHVHRVRDAIQPSHPLLPPSPPAPNPSQHQSLFQ